MCASVRNPSCLFRARLTSSLPRGGPFAWPTWMERSACSMAFVRTKAGRLGKESLKKGALTCPWHNYSFDLRTGVAEQDPELKVEVFEATVENGELRAKV